MLLVPKVVSVSLDLLSHGEIQEDVSLTTGVTLTVVVVPGQHSVHTTVKLSVSVRIA